MQSSLFRMTGATIAGLLLAAMIGCADEDAPDLARVGEACGVSADCEAGLACLEQEGRCVVLCEPGSDACGPGIACEAAGDVGFCPLPPVD